MDLDIVLIDDNRIDRIISRRAIAEHWPNARISDFAYADEALAALRERDDAADLILLDINMPRMTGPEFLHATCDDPSPGVARNIFLMLTTPLHPQDRQDAMAHPAVCGLIDKPLDAASLDEISARISQVAAPSDAILSQQESLASDH